MAEDSAIEWCDHTFNVVWGCQKVSPGCTNCYAETWAKRHGHDVWGPAGTTSRRVLSDDYWKQPLKWAAKARKAGTRAKVFCSSMADVFEDHPTVAEQRLRLWPLIAATADALDWLLLTKRPENMIRFAPPEWAERWPDNAWAMTSVENQEQANKRIPLLVEVPARIRGLSMEPLLGPVNLEQAGAVESAGPAWAGVNPLIDWVIAGGESGPKARPPHPEWFRSVRDQCVAAGVPFLFKQWGEYAPAAWNKPDPKPAMAVSLDGSSVYAQVGHVLGFRGPYEVCMERIGKKAAGRLLDGRTWDQVPS